MSKIKPLFLKEVFDINIVLSTELDRRIVQTLFCFRAVTTTIAHLLSSLNMLLSIPRWKWF